MRNIRLLLMLCARQVLHVHSYAKPMSLVFALFEICGLLGCSDDVEFKWFELGNHRTIAGFVNDSLAVLTDCRDWLEVTETWNGDYGEESSCGHDQMYVYNYRVQEDSARWSDSLSNKKNGWRWNQLTDSIFWRFAGEYAQTDLLLWKIGQKSHKKALSKNFVDCSEKFKIKKMRPWVAGNFIALGDQSLNMDGDNCQYAILDTVAQTLTFGRLDNSLSWIQKCDDVRAWGNDVYCVILNDDSNKSAIIKNAKDSIDVPFVFGMGGFWGNMLKLSSHLCQLENDTVQCSEITWLGGLEFYENDTIVVDLN